MYKVYLKVKPEYDGRVFEKKYKTKTEYREIIRNELITLEIVNKYKIPLYMLDVVSVHETSVFWSFGVRFSIEYPY